MLIVGCVGQGYWARSDNYWTNRRATQWLWTNTNIQQLTTRTTQTLSTSHRCSQVLTAMLTFGFGNGGCQEIKT